jgi:hypothetical protein
MDTLADDVVYILSRNSVERNRTGAVIRSKKTRRMLSSMTVLRTCAFDNGRTDSLYSIKTDLFLEIPQRGRGKCVRPENIPGRSEKTA